MNVVFYDRDNTSYITQLDLDYEVERYSKEAIGGPKQATISVKGDDRELWRLITRVRCPVKIYSDKGDAVWWGYASNIEATVLYPDRPEIGRVNVGVSVDDMYNSVAIAYAKVDIADGTKSRDTTSYFEDAISITSYGRKQILHSPGAATTEHADAAGTATLYQSRYPEPIIDSTEETQSGAVITCRGWWDTMAWQYYANSGTASVDTATQAGTIITSKGQFFNTFWQDVNSGITLRETRDGDNTALYFTMQMLETGTSNFRRMLVDVDPYLNVRLYEEPARPAYPYRLLADGSFENPYGEPIRNELCPISFWARRVDIISMSLDSYLLSDASWLFVEGMEYEVATDKLTHRARGDLDPWEFPVVRYG